MTGFFKRVYRIVRNIPRGKVATYGQIARLAGSPHAARIVGWSMSSSSTQDRVPWHRVVGAGGHLIIAKSLEYQEIQRQLLQNEGVQFRGSRVAMREFQWSKGLDKSARRKKAKRRLRS